MSISKARNVFSPQSISKQVLSENAAMKPPQENSDTVVVDDEPMWAADRVVASTPSSAITIPESTNEFSIKGNHLTFVKGNQFDGRIKTDPHKHIHEFLRICDMFNYKDTKNKAVRLMMFLLSLTGEAKTWLDKLNEGTIETWDELRTVLLADFPLALFDRLLGEIQAFA
ncbi:hypothetical protein Tco_0625025 [Tanacetum coccineum]|uniref:Reverse transcriptase domain-containing protein n=1 Tax=Tanacetum coccineum TaxID=301880 RepID=A0ABQ4WFL0_9ASTR